MTETTDAAGGSPQQSFTSTTAPGVVFTSRQALAEHYKSDWHAYNLKRRQAGLPFLLQQDFIARLQAAQALRLEKERAASLAGQAHLKQHSSKKDKNKSKKDKNNNKDGAAAAGVVMVSQRAAYDSIQEEQQAVEQEQQQEQAKEEQEPAKQEETTVLDTSLAVRVVPNADSSNDTCQDSSMNDVDTSPVEPAAAVAANVDTEKQQQQQQQQQQEPEEIDPCQSLFDRHVSCSVAGNIRYMHDKYGFFIPDAEYLQDAEGLIGFCHEKITLGKLCLYCHRQFSPLTATTSAIQAHMRDSQHCKLKYESGIDLEDLLVFYDFESANEEFWSTKTTGSSSAAAAAATADSDSKMEEDDDGVVAQGGEGEGEWEDVSDNEDGDDDAKMAGDDDEEDDDDDYNDLLQEQVQRMGWNVTELGELIFPDGRIIGHRALRRYYKQRSGGTFSSYQKRAQQSAAVQAARLAGRERLVRGRVVQLPVGDGDHAASSSSATSAMVASSRFMAMGIPTSLAMGRGGKGILVPSSNGNTGNNASSFTQLSLYRFRAVLRQQKKDEMRAQKLKNRTAQNMNRMDKKANRLMNNVSVAHAKR